MCRYQYATVLFTFLSIIVDHPVWQQWRNQLVIIWSDLLWFQSCKAIASPENHSRCFTWTKNMMKEGVFNWAGLDSCARTVLVQMYSLTVVCRWPLCSNPLQVPTATWMHHALRWFLRASPPGSTPAQSAAVTMAKTLAIGRGTVSPPAPTWKTVTKEGWSPQKK